MAPPTESNQSPGDDSAGTLAVVEDRSSLRGENAQELVRPSGILRQLEWGYLYCDRLIGRVVPDSLNPLLHSGAIAVSSFLVATVTGIILLLWYRPSVHLAYASVAMMSQEPLSAGLMRSLHRYSSDACVFFGVIHALRFFLERRFGGARWLAWVSGISIMGLLWFTGWTGYWLVWDLRAQSLAVGSAKLLDVLPIFADPLGRSFLTDEGVNSLLFFVVFFVHMLVPLAMAVFLWIHITRLARSRFLTRKPMTMWLAASLLLLSLAYPAGSAEPARMTSLVQTISMDWWYLLPLTLTDRMGGGGLWALLLLGSAVVFSVPWWLAGRRTAPATVTSSRCNECRKCYTDCPYEAIQMVPRTDGSTKFRSEAFVVSSKCVSCGICAGSCDTAGIGLDWFSSIDQRRRIEGWLKEGDAKGEAIHIAFACVESAAGELRVNAASGRCDELPGYRMLAVPCAGWVQPLLIERALRHGAKGVAIASCEPGECLYREGADWERERLNGQREPALRTDKVAAEQVRLIAFNRTRKADFIREALRFRDGERAPSATRYRRVTTAAAAAAMAALSAGIMGLASDFRYTAPAVEGSQLVVSLKHPGAVSENCRTASAEELASQPVHMRRTRVCDRERVPVRLRVSLDGKPAVLKHITPSGIWQDGNSVAVERIAVQPGEHRVSVGIGETADPDEWSFNDEVDLLFTSDTRRVVVFDRVAGFSWH